MRPVEPEDFEQSISERLTLDAIERKPQVEEPVEGRIGLCNALGFRSTGVRHGKAATSSSALDIRCQVPSRCELAARGPRY